MGKLFAAILLLVVGGFLLLSQRNLVAPLGQGLSSTPTQVEPTGSIQENQSQTATVTILSSSFSPIKLTIKSGTKVIWVNKSGQTISINSDPHPSHTTYPPLNLGQVDEGNSVSLVFDKAGTYGYHNHFNPSQIGSIVVE